MSTSNDLSVVLRVDIPKSVSAINADITKVQSQIKHLRVGISLDPNAVKQLDSQFKTIQSMSGGKVNLGFDSNQLRQYSSELDKLIQKESINAKTGEIINEQTKIRTDELGRQVKEVEKLNKEFGNWERKSTETTTDFKKQTEARRQASADARKLMNEEEKLRIQTTTKTQSDIEKTILNSNETIANQQKRMNRVNAHDYEQRWKQAILNKERQESTSVSQQATKQKQEYNALNALLQKRHSLQKQLHGADEATTLELKKQLALIQAQIRAKATGISQSGLKSQAMAVDLVGQEKARISERNVAQLKHNKALEDANKKLLTQSNMHNKIAKNMTVFDSFIIAMKRIPMINGTLRGNLQLQTA